jgi:Arc/MetJ-type ribon-helix-helix transcriptional regulator
MMSGNKRFCMGRKPTGEETRNATVSVTLFQSEADALTVLAARRTVKKGHRVTVSELIREAIQQLLTRG